MAGFRSCLAIGAALMGAAFSLPALASLDEAQMRIVPFEALVGWAEDDHVAAMDAFIETCQLLDDPQWLPICTLAQDYPGSARSFFELFFRPVLIEDGQPGLFTAYFEPELAGSEYRSGRYTVPVYARPPEIAAGTANYTRKQIEEDGVLAGRGCGWGSAARTASRSSRWATNWSGAGFTTSIRSPPRSSRTGCAPTRPRGAIFCRITRPTFSLLRLPIFPPIVARLAQ